MNPHTIARDIIAATSLTDPDAIADAINERTPDADLRDAYRSCLRAVARDAIRTLNMAARNPEPPTPTRATPARSSKVAAIRQAHIDYWDQRVYASGEWKMLGDCGVADLDDLIAQRRAIAAKNNAVADEYERLRDQMVAQGAAVAREVGEVAA